MNVGLGVLEELEVVGASFAESRGDDLPRFPVEQHLSF
ncbi:MAG: hypothetical protein AVDCRST_MAG93-1440 [uncultured Chloroflexia bacterium]|uniref:Uncharacterized protein n=1 Tax=uncultured Chloroflexia bacterium TaxID=1672391 RepID=A0A6J4I6S7_9CHLR|nr:MAG: hypothetical protein AVDCRST_MAG93-1440 [uncultured Chloroflexia bacterium]